MKTLTTALFVFLAGCATDEAAGPGNEKADQGDKRSPHKIGVDSCNEVLELGKFSDSSTETKGYADHARCVMDINAQYAPEIDAAAPRGVVPAADGIRDYRGLISDVCGVVASARSGSAYAETKCKSDLGLALANEIDTTVAFDGYDKAEAEGEDEVPAAFAACVAAFEKEFTATNEPVSLFAAQGKLKTCLLTETKRLTAAMAGSSDAIDAAAMTLVKPCETIGAATKTTDSRQVVYVLSGMCESSLLLSAANELVEAAK